MISFARIRAVFLKELVQMRRDRPTFAIMILVPIMQLTLFGFAIDTDPRHLPTAVELRDDGPLTRSLLASLRQSDYFRIVAQVSTDDEGERLMRAGEGEVGHHAAHRVRLVDDLLPTGELISEVDDGRNIVDR